MLGKLVASWGVFGVLALLAQACWRLGLRAVEALQMELTPIQLGVFVAWVAFNGYAEGYRAFQLRFSPRVVVRAMHLARNLRPLHAILAPFYCMALIHSNRRGKALAWGTTVMVLCFILLLRYVPQPWRGVIDGGVVAALAWGGGAILVFYVRAMFQGRPPRAAPLLPGD